MNRLGDEAVTSNVPPMWRIEGAAVQCQHTNTEQFHRNSSTFCSIITTQLPAEVLKRSGLKGAKVIGRKLKVKCVRF